MAANFWTSSHCKQLLDPEDVELVPAADRERGITPEEFRLVKIHMSFHIWRLAQQVKVRQRVIATAVTYFRRVYTRKSMSEYDPRLVAPTCLYLASKVEESTVQARLLVFYIKKMCGMSYYRICGHNIFSWKNCTKQLFLSLSKVQVPMISIGLKLRIFLKWK